MSGSINDQDGKSRVRGVGLKITTGGVPFKYPISAVTRHNRYAQANNFTIKIALYGDPAHDLKWWGQLDRVDAFPIEIIFSVEDPASGTTITQTMMSGQVDKMSIDTRKGIVTAHGRDYWSLFIETYTLLPLEGRSTNDVLEYLVGNHPGLEFVSEQTQNPDVSKMYRDNGIVTIGAQGSPLTNEANLAIMVAQRANSFLYFDGNILRCRDYTDIDGIWEVTFTPPYNNDSQVVILNPSNAEDIVLERDLNLARNTRVRSWSYDPVEDHWYYADDTQSQLRGGLKGPSIQRVYPGAKHEEELKQLSNTTYDQVIRHEKKVHWTEPGSLYLTVLYKMVLIPDDVTDWHQEYWIESIDRTMDWKGGFSMECIGSNADPALANDEAY